MQADELTQQGCKQDFYLVFALVSSIGLPCSLSILGCSCYLASAWEGFLFGWTPVQDYPFGLQYPQQEFLLKAPERGGFCHV